MASNDTAYSADVCSVRDLLRDHKFIVPDYQRPYAWDEDMAVQLVTDIDEAYNSKKSKEYFLGSMVLSGKEDDKVAKVIDGQQRVTTIFLILMAMKYKFSELDADTAIAKINKLIYSNSNATKVNKSRLQLTKADYPYLKKLHETDDQEELDSFRYDQRDTKHKRRAKNSSLFSNYSAIAEKIEDLLKGARQKRSRASALGELLDYLLENVMVAVIRVATESDAFKVFEALNDKRLELSSADLIKVQLFIKLASLKHSERDEEALKEKWDQISEKLKRGCRKSCVSGLNYHTGGTDGHPRQAFGRASQGLQQA